jgi:hypothetical protein
LKLYFLDCEGTKFGKDSFDLKEFMYKNANGGDGGKSGRGGQGGE